jgi:hypothetical protein
MTRHVKLSGTFTTRSPLSHIGETISTGSYLVQEPILQPDGSIEEVFCYSGNAWRGQLRDLSATYMLAHLKTAVPLEAFHLLYSGGRIGGDQKVDIGAARAMRAAIPHVSVFGGGVGNQILPGKLRVSNAYPICAEAMPALPESVHERAVGVSYRGLTFEKEFSRKDDAKDERLTPYVASVETLLLEGAQETKRDGPADQMRMRAELLIAGVSLWTELECLGVSEVELGCIAAALHEFAKSPHIGGQANKGHGLVSLRYQMLDMDTGEVVDFLKVDGEVAKLGHAAQEAKAAYDGHLRALYDRMLETKGGEIRALLGAA